MNVDIIFFVKKIKKKLKFVMRLVFKRNEIKKGIRCKSGAIPVAVNRKNSFSYFVTV